MYKCGKCKQELEAVDTYEYRGAYACESCFDDVINSRDSQRNEIILEENAKTEKFKHLDLGDNAIGRANCDILKRQIEIAKKESVRLKAYENRLSI